MTKLTVLLLALLAASASAFGVGTPLQQTTPTVTRSTSPQWTMRARECDLLGKRANRKARVVTFSHKRIHKVQAVNLQWKRFYSDDLKRNVRLRLSTKGLKTVQKYGSIDAAAKKFDVDISKF